MFVIIFYCHAIDDKSITVMCVIINLQCISFKSLINVFLVCMSNDMVNLSKAGRCVLLRALNESI